eukprot:TRINITY_DN781980_c0_g1_i1.p1 TRINITY_DN781980_c0_g1~~TRINITY_DN781980_c0_g1_i1.p1  ORF type:complete len:371 (+),score=88.44 TRINITY_DN781980_c0_g1_i1:37-1149(+)
MGCTLSSESSNKQKIQKICGERKICYSYKTCSLDNARRVKTFCGVIKEAKKDQDRFSIVPNMAGGFYAGVYDGHGVNGKVHADLAAEKLPILIENSIKSQKAQLGKDGNSEVKDEDDIIKIAFGQAFQQFQLKREKFYTENVVAEVKKIHQQLQSESGIYLDPVYPIDGGTTATCVVATENSLVFGWVGDSSVIAVYQKGDVLVPEKISLDHDLKCTEESARVLRAGGKVSDNYLTVDQADGAIQVTRSLGDAPFHKDFVVSSIPDTAVIKLNESAEKSPKFIILASDGVWNVLSHDLICDILNAKRAECRIKRLPADVALQSCCERIVEIAVETTVEKSLPRDDMSMLVIELLPYDDGGGMRRESVYDI